MYCAGSSRQRISWPAFSQMIPVGTAALRALIPSPHQEEKKKPHSSH